MSQNVCDYISLGHPDHIGPLRYKRSPPEAHYQYLWGSHIYRLAKYLASLLGLHLDNFLHHVRNSEDIFHMLDTLCVSPKDILISFDGISLFTKFAVRDALNF
jgi:hypothetical protein